MYAGTISTSGQRCVNAVAAEIKDFILFRLDVSQVCANGLAFQEPGELTGTDARDVQFDVPTVGIDCSRRVGGFETFNFARETFVLTPIYGSNGAPRALRKKFHQVLTQWVSCRKLCSEPECVHRSNQQGANDITVRAREHDEEQHRQHDIPVVPRRKHKQTMQSQMIATSACRRCQRQCVPAGCGTIIGASQ